MKIKYLVGLIVLSCGMAFASSIIQPVSINQTAACNAQQPLQPICVPGGSITGMTSYCWSDGTCQTTAATSTNVLGTTLTGFVSGAGTVSASDTVLSAFDKVTGNITAITYTAGQFPATTAGTDASAGNVGVYFSSTATNGSLGAGTYADLTSIVLPPGDWDVSLSANINGTGGSSVSNFIFGVSTTTGNTGTGMIESKSKQTGGNVGIVITNVSIPRIRFNSSGSQTIYLKAYADWVGGAGPAVTGTITARNPR